MPNDIHDMRFETLQEDSNDRFIESVRQGEGAVSTNLYLNKETGTLGEEPASGHQVLQLAARLFPAKDFPGADGGDSLCLTMKRSSAGS